MSEEYKKFLSFLNKNVNNETELDCIIYNIGTTQRIVEQFSHFYNQKIKQDKIQDTIEFEIDFENQCNEKIHLALNIGDSATLFVECELQDNNFIVHINKQRIAELTLEGMKNG